MKLYNPTKNDITVQIKGVEYTIEAESELKGIPERWNLYSIGH